MISIVIPAHNEAAVIARSLGMLTADADHGDVEIIVVCNGCSDNTAEIARRFAPTVRVIETDVASKIRALNMGDAAATSFPRMYIDADVVISMSSVRALAKRLAIGDVHAIAPTPNIDVRGCSSLVRAYYAVRALLPSARQGIGGSGVYGLSAAGRSRFAAFPDVIADDAFVRLQFTPAERVTEPSITSRVYAPRTVRGLLAVRSRVYFGIAELASRFPNLSTKDGPSNNGTLIGLSRRPTMWPALTVYVLINMVARYLGTSRRRRKVVKWNHDQTSRGLAV